MGIKLPLEIHWFTLCITYQNKYQLPPFLTSQKGNNNVWHGFRAHYGSLLSAGAQTNTELLDNILCFTVTRSNVRN